jgi:Protein of unknown function (DUF1344)
MKNMALPLFATAIVMVMGSSPSWAWTDVTGTVVAVIPSYKQIELDDRHTYTLAQGITMSGVKPGDNVTLSTETQNNKNIVNQVTKNS